VLSGVGSAVVQEPVDGDSRNGNAVDGEVVDKEQNIKPKDINTKNKQQEPANQDSSIHKSDSLVFNSPFTPVAESQARVLLEECPAVQRQCVIDEVVWIFKRGRLRGNACALLRRLIERAKAGTFIPNAPAIKQISETGAEKEFPPSGRRLSEYASQPVSTDTSRKIVDEIRRSLRSMPQAK
jgi:hypothetical protein